MTIWQSNMAMGNAKNWRLSQKRNYPVGALFIDMFDYQTDMVSSSSSFWGKPICASIHGKGSRLQLNMGRYSKICRLLGIFEYSEYHRIAHDQSFGCIATIAQVWAHSTRCHHGQEVFLYHGELPTIRLWELYFCLQKCMIYSKWNHICP